MTASGSQAHCAFMSLPFRRFNRRRLGGKCVSGLHPKPKTLEIVVADKAAHQCTRHRVRVSARPCHLPKRRYGHEEPLAAVVNDRAQKIAAVRLLLESEAVVFVLVQEFEPARP